MQNVTEIRHSFDAMDIAPMKMGRDFDKCEMVEVLRDNGIGFDSSIINMRELDGIFAMDSFPTIQSGLTSGSIPALLQNLQNWLPGMVMILTAARKIDEIVGITTTGAWEDEEIVMPVLENTANVQLYGDLTNPPLSNWNLNFNTRTNVRAETAMRVGVLEEARSARQRVNSGQMKRDSCALGLEVFRNAVGFYGYNSGNNNTYGFLNDPALPAYVQVAQGSSTSTYNWSTKTFLEIQTDILTALQTLRTQSQDTIEPGKTPLTMAISTNRIDYLAKTSDFGISVWDWLKSTYPNIRVISAPQLNLAFSSDNVFYVFADSVNDTSTDDKKSIIQVISQKFFIVGIQKLAKGYEEDYSNCTAGCMVKRPYAFVRYYDI